MNSNVIVKLRTLLQNAQNILIALADNADDDTVAAGLALYLTLQKMQKQATVVASADVKVAQSYLYGVDRITKQATGGNSLVVSFPYEEGSIEKVTYNIEGNRFNLVIEPRENKLNFNQNQVEYSYGKGDYDTVFVLGARDFKSLGSLYTNNKTVFGLENVVNIDNHQDNTGFGSVNIVENAPISMSLALLLRALRIPVEPDPASNLYTGIINATKGLSFATATPDALEAVAFLLRGKAQLLKKDGIQIQKNAASTYKNDDFADDVKTPALDVDQSIPEQNVQDLQDNQNAPDDWLKPKIFTTHNN